MIKQATAVRQGANRRRLLAASGDAGSGHRRHRDRYRLYASGFRFQTFLGAQFCALKPSTYLEFTEDRI